MYSLGGYVVPIALVADGLCVCTSKEKHSLARKLVGYRQVST